MLLLLLLLVRVFAKIKSLFSLIEYTSVQSVIIINADFTVLNCCYTLGLCFAFKDDEPLGAANSHARIFLPMSIEIIVIGCAGSI